MNKQKVIQTEIIPKNWVDEENWFEELVKRARVLEREMSLGVWKKYSECGKLLIEVGYKHSLQARGFKKKFMEAMGIKSPQTINTMLQLGRMNDQELSNTLENFGTIHNFSNKLPVNQDVIEYRKEHAKKPKVAVCNMGLECFPHCCPCCPYYEKRKVEGTNQ